MVSALGHPEQSLLALGLGIARCLPIAWLVPAFGGPALPPQIRVAVGGGLSVLCLPTALSQVPTGGIALWLALLVREVGVGVTMGFVVSCAFRAAECAGGLADSLRGADMTESTSPLTGGRSSPLGQLLLLFATVIFMDGGGPALLATALAQSYEAIPLVPSPGSTGAHHAAVVVIAASAKLIESALGLAAPALVAILLADLVLGLVGRASSHLPCAILGLPLRALLGVAAVLVSISAIDGAIKAGFRGFLALAERLFMAR